MRIEPLGLRAIYDAVHREGADDPRQSPGGVEGQSTSPEPQSASQSGGVVA
jgi:hypothetical protein